ncbi:MAG TPA: hypothetical protein VKT82_15280 [Ktedonobacterales bacterium]|nr:hypothetical protein [Ktedonobacterales bacterium]
MKHIAFALALLVLLLAGCSGSPAPTTQASATVAITQPSTLATTQPTLSTTPGSLGAPGCHPPSSEQTSAIGGPEVHGTSANGSLWLLLFGDTKVGVDLKIVWRMTGTGDLHLIAIGPQGQRVAPDWGPEAHGGSNWNRPGDEWGAGFTMPVVGCWDLRATRDNTSGDAWLVFTK